MAIILKDFIDNPNIVNIELGAGCSNFGQKYFPECFITDSRTPNELKQNCLAHSVTIYSCDAHNIPCESNRFRKLFICNPFNYGFKDSEEGVILLNELARVLTHNGEALILSASSNKYAMPKRIERRVQEFNDQSNLIKFVYSYQEIDCQKEYFEHKFLYTNGFNQTFPSNRILLTCNK